MATEKKVLPFGAWKSPLTSATITKAGVKLMDTEVRGSRVFWVEGRPEEKGRHVLVAMDLSGGEATDVTPAHLNVRTRVHEYGGGHLLVSPDGDEVRAPPFLIPAIVSYELPPPLLPPPPSLPPPPLLP
jgi:hypothetical protein